MTEQATQRGCAVSILGLFQSRMGSRLEQLGMSPERTCFEQEVGQGPPEVLSSLNYPMKSMNFSQNSAEYNPHPQLFPI